VPEAREIADGSTGYSTGNLYAMVGGKGVHSVKEKWDEDAMKTVVASRAAAVDFTRERVKELPLIAISQESPGACSAITKNRNPMFKKSRRQPAQPA
jgi:hypothetical protein